MADALSELSVQAATDPEAVATVSDFTDYTEFFPSDLSRSLTLISNLDESFLEDAAKVHELTKTYGQLPNFDPANRPDAKVLRQRIAFALDHAVRSRESAYAEASRIFNVADTLYKRLKGIRTKLQALPKPPSRDPTPVPQSKSPNAVRARPNQDGERVPRLTLVFDGNRPGSRGSQSAAPQPKRRSRFIVPGEILPPFDVNTPGPGETSESESEPPSPAKHGRVGRDTLKIPKLKFSRDRPHGTFGTNVHSSVAGISVSNALAQLPQPPQNPTPGSRHAPWLQLTEWELNKLRKKMKKNANWVPSDTMVRRELLDRNRGLENMMKAKKRHEETGEEFLDEGPAPFSREPLSNYNMVIDWEGNGQVENRGMRLNNQKKQKQARESAAAAQGGLLSALDDTTRQIMNAGLTVQGLLSPNTNAITSESMLWQVPTRANTNKKSKKRKRVDKESSPNADERDNASPSVEASIKPEPKRIRLQSSATPNATAGATTTVKVPLAPPARSPAPASAADARDNKTEAASNKPSTPGPTDVAEDSNSSATTRTRARGTNGLQLTLTHKAASAEPQTRRESLRRVSSSSMPSTQLEKDKEKEKKATATPATAASSRPKRPAPGLLKYTTEGGGAKISVSKRKAASDTSKKAAAAGQKSSKPDTDNSTILEEGDYDPNEERYCICNDFAWGDMVGCENEDKCPIEWFHLSCVGLKTVPGPRTKWWCPDCKEALFGRQKRSLRGS